MGHWFSFKRTLLVSLLYLLAAGAHTLAQTPIIHYSLPRAGKVSLAVYDAQGRQVRTLLAGESQTAGKHTAEWDGLDRLGRAMAVGGYEWPTSTTSAISTGLPKSSCTHFVTSCCASMWL